MLNVYLDPDSYVNLQNALFTEAGWRSLREYFSCNGINLNTIDRWTLPSAQARDVYVSYDHKFFPRRLYWKRKNKAYPVRISGHFRKKILLQFEPPNVMPEIPYLIHHILESYDTVFFSWKIDNPNIRHFHLPQAHNGILPQYWQNEQRKFLTIINSNRKPLFRSKDLLTERVRAILSLGKTGDIDLYGYDWDQAPLFPYWFSKNAIQKAYRGTVQDKLETLSEYRFALAFENCALPGYITEKIFDCFYAGTIPVYLGAPDVAEYVPTYCFIDMRKFKNYDELRSFLKSLSQEQIAAYKEHGRRFLESGQYKPFTKEHFAKLFLEACYG